MFAFEKFCCKKREEPVYEEVKMDEDDIYTKCVSTQTDPISSEEEVEDIEYAELNPETMEDLLLVERPIEYEEIVLKRSKSYRKLGLTLCYGGEGDTDTDIFISEIEKGSVADRSGRVRIGDQILQINGMPIHSRKDAISQFSKGAEEIILLVAREHNSAEDEEDDDDEDIEIECQGMSGPSGQNGPTLSPLPENDDGQLTENSALEKDSGLSRATDSEPDGTLPSQQYFSVQCQPRNSMPNEPKNFGKNQNEESLERELAYLHQEMENIRLECDRLINKRVSSERRAAQQVAQASNIMDMLNRFSTSNSPTHQNFRQQTPQLPYYPQRQPPPMPHFLTHKSSSQNQNLAYFHPNMHAPPSPMLQNNRKLIEETSSAYNTGGDSCRSTPMKGEYVPGNDAGTNTYNRPLPPPPKRPLHLTTTEKFINSPISPTSSEHPYHTIETPVSSAPTVQFRLPKYKIHVTTEPPPKPMQMPPPPTNKPEQKSKKQVEQQSLFKPGDIMYTSPDKLAETIALQQRLLRERMIQEVNLLKPSSSNSQNGCHKNGHGAKNQMATSKNMDSEQKYEWKVKRRPDGTRYITRRPLRNRMLKAREEQLKRERQAMSTDDDAGSELKVGKFWSREERKRHLERAKERKQRQQQMLMEKVKNPNEQIIMQLSHRKQMKKTGQQLFDKFTTIQEYLAHGTRDPSTRPIGGILSVTTV
uniref:PDZ domain-containing protein n=1 Tax=Acrobeloides nanus TaxID=290746 RepID=A0A914D0G3_9BILA